FSSLTSLPPRSSLFPYTTLFRSTRHFGRYLCAVMHQRAFVQDRFGFVQCRHIGTLKEFSNRDFFAPEQRSLHSQHPVSRIVRRIVFEFLHPRPEPLVGVVMVIGNAGAKYVQKRKPFVLDALFDQFSEMLLLATEAAGNERSSGGQSQRYRVHRRLDIAKRHALRLHANAAGG